MRRNVSKFIQQTFRSLSSRNYRLFFIGQSVSLAGSWMQQVALSWLVYTMTGSAFLLGVVNFAAQVPSFVLAPFAGVTADRYPKRNVLFITQGLAMLQAVTLTFLVFNNTITVWQIVLLSFLLGIVNAYDIPARHAFTVEMIEKKADLSNAIAMNSTMFNLARLAGPAVAGVVIVLWGEPVCFLVNAVSYLAVIMSLVAMRIKPRKIDEHTRDLWLGLKEGFVYAFGFAPIRSILFLLGSMSLMGVSYQLLMPVFAKDIFHGGPHTLGFLVGTTGAGALAGALYLAARKNVLGLSRVIAYCTGIFGIGVMGFSLSRVFWLSLVLMVSTGFAMMVVMAACNTVLQTITDDDKRGRIMSFYTMTLMGMAPFGSLLAGWLASRIGAPNTVLLGGFFCLIGSLFFARQIPAFRAQVRPIYVQRGIIPGLAIPENPVER